MATKLATLALCCLALAGTACAGRPVHHRYLEDTNPCAGQPDGAVVPAGGCTATFHTCVNGNIHFPDQACSSPLVFNPAAHPAGCSEIGAVGTVGCNCAARYSGDLLTACQVCQQVQKEGDFAFPGAPNQKYAQCALDAPHVGKCDAGLVFCQKLDACLYPSDKC